MKFLLSILAFGLLLLPLPTTAQALSTEATWYAFDTPQVHVQDPFLIYQWDVQKMRLPLAWSYTLGSSDIVVAVIDSGLDTSNGEFAGRALPTINLVPGEDDLDYIGHGTHVTGIIAAAMNDVGTVGVSPYVKILPIKVLDKLGQTGSQTVARAIDLARQNGASIINMSIGGEGQDLSVKAAIDRAVKANIVVIAASGNSGDKGNPIMYPAAYPGVMAVSASDQNDLIPSWSSTGPYISVSAPGVQIMSLYPLDLQNINYLTLSGTSMAAPHVTGVAALVKSINQGLDVAQVMDIIERTASRDTDVYSDLDGWGRVDAFGAIRLAQQMSGTPDPMHFIFLPGLQR